MSDSAALVVSYNGRSCLEHCLSCLYKQSRPFGTILVVDNGSSDQTGDWLAGKYPHIQLLRLEKNRGFSGGVNHGLRHLLTERRFEYVALINNDVYLEPDWHQAARKSLLADLSIGVCATCLLRERQPDLVDTGGICWTALGRAENYLSGQAAPSVDQPDQELFGACAAAALYRVELFRQIGLFDERLFAYQEDVDLALRARAGGWRCIFTAAARGLHTGHASNRPFPVNGSYADYFNARNRLAVLVSSLPATKWRLQWRAILGTEAVALMTSLRERRAVATWIGFVHGLLLLPGRLYQRWRNSEESP